MQKATKLKEEFINTNKMLQQTNVQRKQRNKSQEIENDRKYLNSVQEQMQKDIEESFNIRVKHNKLESTKDKTCDES